MKSVADTMDAEEEGAFECADCFPRKCDRDNCVPCDVIKFPARVSANSRMTREVHEYRRMRISKWNFSGNVFEFSYCRTNNTDNKTIHQFS